MMIAETPCKYAGPQDLEKMLDILIAGRKADNGTHYVHPGDLKWWLFYLPLEGDLREHIYLWDDVDRSGGYGDTAAGWALLSLDWNAFDVFIDPVLRGTLAAEAMYLWAEEQITAAVRRMGRDRIRTLWIFEDDLLLRDYLKRRGFQIARYDVYMVRSLEGELPDIPGPEGYQVRSLQGEAEIVSRAQASYHAFENIASFEPYLERYRRFRSSPVYEPEMEVVAVAPDGRVGAFCIGWLDAVNQVGSFEPVGAHPDFQRRGLGKAVMMACMRRMQARGMRQATVVTTEDNLPAVKLYQSLGFRTVNRLCLHEKEIEVKNNEH